MCGGFLCKCKLIIKPITNKKQRIPHGVQHFRQRRSRRDPDLAAGSRHEESGPQLEAGAAGRMHRGRGRRRLGLHRLRGVLGAHGQEDQRGRGRGRVARGLSRLRHQEFGCHRCVRSEAHLQSSRSGYARRGGRSDHQRGRRGRLGNCRL